jgi:hypothetical protein
VKPNRFCLTGTNASITLAIMGRNRGLPIAHCSDGHLYWRINWGATYPQILITECLSCYVPNCLLWNLNTNDLQLLH